MLNFEMADRVIAVTGGASGIGKATSLALAAEGAKVAVIDLRAADVDACVDELLNSGATAIGIAVDVSDTAGMKAAAERVARELGDVSGLVTSAGTSATARAEDMPADDFTRVMAVNALGTLISCQVFAQPMIAGKGGSIVAIGSINSFGGQAGRVGYVASKFAVNGLVKSLALEWGRHGVRVNGIAPGLIDTPLARNGVPASFFDLVVDRTPMGRIGTSEDIAQAVLMMLSDASAFISGVMLPVDGGMTSGYFNRRSGADLSSLKLLEAGIYED